MLKRLREVMDHAGFGAPEVEPAAEMETQPVLAYHLVRDHRSTPKSKPAICFTSLGLDISISQTVYDLMHGINVLDMYDILETSPPLPLKMCFDQLVHELMGHLTRTFPALFGAHSISLRNNSRFLSLSLESIFRITNASINRRRKDKADQAYQHLVDKTEATLRGIGLRISDTSLPVSDSATEDKVVLDKDIVAQNAVRRMYHAWITGSREAGLPSFSETAPKTEELTKHDDTPKLEEDHIMTEDTELHSDLDSSLCLSTYDMETSSCRLSAPVESPLDMEEPLTSPLPSLFCDEPVCAKLFGLSWGYKNAAEENEAQYEILEF